MVDQRLGARASEGPKDGEGKHAGAKTPTVAGAPTDAMLSFAEALAKGKTRDDQQPDRHVLTAFALGWEMAAEYRTDAGGERLGAAADDLARAGLAGAAHDPAPAGLTGAAGDLARGHITGAAGDLPREGSTGVADDLPDLGALSADALAELGFDMIEAGLTKLREPIASAGLAVPDARRFGRRLHHVHDPQERKAAIRRFHLNLFCTLTAADYRLGRAYAVGVALADITRHPADYRAELTPYRAAAVTSSIRELATVFPAHAAHSVADSVQAWARSVGRAAATDDDSATLQLAAQGRLWRSLLSGEKRATDMLETSDYLRAAERTVAHSAALALRFLRHYWWLVALVVGLFAAGIVVIATATSTAAIVAGAGPLIASFGLSWKGIGASMATTTSRLERPVWEAELDTAIYERITPQRLLDGLGPIVAGPDEPSLAVVGPDEPSPAIAGRSR